MAQDHGLDYLFGNIEILTALTRDMLHREAEHGQWVGQLDRLTARCEEMRGDEEWDCRDTDALVDGFTRDIEREADAASEVARISGELAMYNAAYYNPETAKAHRDRSAYETDGRSVSYTLMNSSMR